VWATIRPPLMIIMTIAFPVLSVWQEALRAKTGELTSGLSMRAILADLEAAGQTRQLKELVFLQVGTGIIIIIMIGLDAVVM
jgi:hypothetical protein